MTASEGDSSSTCAAAVRVLAPLWWVVAFIAFQMPLFALAERLAHLPEAGLVNLVFLGGAITLIAHMKGRPALLRVDAAGIHLKNRLVEPTSAIDASWVAAKEPTLVVCGKKVWRLRFESMVEARRAHAVLRIHATRRAYPMRRAELRPGLWQGGSIVLMLMIFGVMVLLPFLRAIKHYLGAIVLPVPKLVAIGDDGLLLRRTRTEEAIPWSDVKDVRWNRTHCTLVLMSGRAIGFYVPAELSVAFATELASARQRYEKAGRARQLPESTAPLAQWVRELRSREGVSYREGALAHDDLVAIALHPGAPPRARVAAAAAAASELSETDRQRLRVTADRSVLPWVSDALSTSARVAGADDGEPAELVELMRRVDN